MSEEPYAALGHSRIANTARVQTVSQQFYYSEYFASIRNANNVVHQQNETENEIQCKSSLLFGAQIVPYERWKKILQAH